MEHYMPVRLDAGPDCVAQNAGRMAALGKRCLLVTGAHSARASGALADVAAALNERGIQYAIYDKIAQNPTVKSCMEAGRIGRDADFVFGIGGGSPLDAAKAAGVFAANPGMTESEFYALAWENAPKPIVLLGTTAGTGSEVTDVSVLTDSSGRKHSVHDPRLYAALALGGAKYTTTLPRDFTVSTGVDALAHCMESYFSRKATEISRAHAVRGARLLIPALEEALESEAPSYNLRQRLYEGSILGGLAISRTGTVFPHNVGYYLTERCGVPHGTACAVFEPDLLAHVGRCAPALAAAFYAEAGTEERELLALLRRAVPPLELPIAEAELRAALPRWENNGTVSNTVGTVTTKQIFEMLQEKILRRSTI